MVKRAILWLLAAFLLLAPAVLHAQEHTYYVQHFNSENGVPNTIKGIQLDREGFIWLATESGLVRYDGSAFKLYNHSDSGATVNRLWVVDTSAGGSIYIETEGNQYFYLTSHNTLRSIPEKVLFAHDTSFHFHPDLPYRIYRETTTRFLKKQLPFWAIPDLKKITQAYANNVPCVNGYYYYINSANELVVTDTSLKRFYRPVLTGPKAAKDRDTWTMLSSLFQRDHDAYVHADSTIFRIALSADRSVATLIPVLSVGAVQTIIGFQPLPGNATYIVGTQIDGIYVFTRKQFNTLTQHFGGDNTFYAQAPFGNNGVLTKKGALLPDTFMPFHSNFDHTTVLHARDGSYYLASRQLLKRGIQQLDSHLDSIRFITSYTGMVRCIRQLSDGSIWLCADSLFIGRIAGDSVHWVPKPSSVPRDFIVAVFTEAGKNVFWVAGNKGLVKADLNTNKLSFVPTLSNINVRSLYQDSLGVLWICTYGSGLYGLYKDKLVSFPLDRDRYLSFAHTILPDHSGYMWVTTNHGLFQIKQSDLYAYLEKGAPVPYYYYYDNTSGFLTNEFNGGCYPAGITLPNGRLSFPSLNGLVQFFPDSLHPLLPRADIFVDNVTADTTTITAVDSTYSIPRKTTFLQVFVSSPYFGNAYNQQLEYALDDRTETWHPLPADKVIELVNLPTGTHVLTIRKRAAFGANGFITKKITLFVEPAFYETIVFRVLLIALLMLAVYLLFVIRTRLLIQQKKKLQEEVLARTKDQQSLIGELQEVVDELEQSQKSLQETVQFKETLAMILAHDLQSPLRFLSDAAGRMHKKNLDSTDPETLDLSYELTKTSSNIYHFVADFVTWIKKVNIDETIDIQPVNVSTLLNELTVFFSELKRNRKNVLMVHAAPDVFVHTDYQLLKIILRNIIDNANKHTREGNITVTLAAGAHTAAIEIADTGSGINPDILRNIQHRMEQPPGLAGSSLDGLGFGYRFIIDFCRLSKITLTIKSQPNGGTTVILSGFRFAANA